MKNAKIFKCLEKSLYPDACENCTFYFEEDGDDNIILKYCTLYEEGLNNEE